MLLKWQFTSTFALLFSIMVVEKCALYTVHTYWWTKANSWTIAEMNCVKSQLNSKNVILPGNMLTLESNRLQS